MNDINQEEIEMTNITEDDIYKIDIILEKSKIDKTAFFIILKLLHITERKTEYKVLNHIINLNNDELAEMAEAIKKLKKE